MIDIHRSTLSDLNNLVEIHHPRSSKDWLINIQKKRIKYEEFYVIEKDKKIIGHFYIDYSGGKRKKEYPYISALYLEKSKRGKGIGTETIKEIEKILKAKGFNKVGLAVNPMENQRAQNLYERLGFEKVSDEKYLDWIDPIDQGEDWVLDMIKNLS